MSKAQLSVMDFSIALIIFTVLITAIILNLNTYPIRLNDQQNKNEMLINAFQISNSLTKNLGNPSSWEDDVNSLNSIGLADFDRRLSIDKVNAFINLDYETAKRIMGFYDFYFRILDLSNNEILSSGQSFNGTSSINIRRYVIYNNEKSILEFTLWE